MKVLIPNATGKSNPGDQAMLEVLVALIKKNIDSVDLIVHSTEKKDYAKVPFKARSTLIEYIYIRSEKTLTRLWRLINLVFVLFLFLVKKKYIYLFRKNYIANIVKDYLEADLIIFVGGGSLRTQKGLSQSINLLFLLLYYLLAKSVHRRTIVAPISFGPFAYEWQTKLASRILNGLDVIAAREEYSMRLMRKMHIKNIIQSVDHALLVENKNKRHSGDKIVGFTIRNWFNDGRQEKLEREYAYSLKHIAQKYSYNIQPIIQVNTPNFPREDDTLPVTRVVAFLRNEGIKCNKPIAINSHKQAISVYGKLDMLLGMRMHSNIIAATQRVPFVAVSYEYKTEGICKILGIGDYCIQAEQVNKNELTKLLQKLHKNHRKVTKELNVRLNTIHKKEYSRWQKILSI